MALLRHRHGPDDSFDVAPARPPSQNKARPPAYMPRRKVIGGVTFDDLSAA
jgi:hypothetical protein